MKNSVNVDDLPEFDPAKYLDNEESIAVFLTGVVGANNAALLVSALEDITRARKNVLRTQSLVDGPTVPFETN